MKLTMIVFALIALCGCESSSPSSAEPFERPTYTTEIYRSPIGTGSVYSEER